MHGVHELVGRERELQRLVHDLTTDGCALVLVRGPAGIGKTSLATAAADAVSEGGRPVLRGRCLPLTTAMPLLPADDPAHGAAWAAERSRLHGVRDPELWAEAAQAWDIRKRPGRAAYARWQQVVAHLESGGRRADARDVLQRAAVDAEHHVPLRTAVATLARRARIELPGCARVAGEAAEDEPATQSAFGLTERELLVLRLVAEGRSNAEIGVELFISRSTASVHVHRILGKLGAVNRVEAATLAERTGLLAPDVLVRHRRAADGASPRTRDCT